MVPETRVVLATRNAHKVAELSRILARTGAGITLVGLEEFPDAPEVPETGLTFADNALLKARAIANFTGLPAVADDSGPVITNFEPAWRPNLAAVWVLIAT